MHESKPSSQELRESWDDSDIRILRSIQFALAAGVVLFVVVVLFLVSSFPQPVSDERSVLNALTAVNVVLFLAVFGLSASIARALIRFVTPQNASTDAWKNSIRQAWILHLASREMAAVAGVVVTLVGVMTGVLPEHAMYWVNVIPAILFVFQCLTDTPGIDRLTRFYTENVLAQQGFK